MPRSIVSVIKDQPITEMVAKSLEVIKFDEIVETRGGQSVVIKPNFADVSRIAPLDFPHIQGYSKISGSEAGVGLPRRGDQTSTEVVEAVARNLKEHVGIKEITIAEASATPTWKAYFMYGIYELAIKHHIRLVDLNNDEAEEIPIPNGEVLKSIYSPRTIRKANIVISVPVLKIWRAVGISINLKNMAGGTLPSHYAPHICTLTDWTNRPRFNPDVQYGQSKTLAAGMVDIASVNRAHVSIVDALTIMHSAKLGGEFSFKYEDVKVEELGAIISGGDMVATDAVGAEIMGFDAKKIVHLNMAKDRGLGTNEMSEIEVRGTSIESTMIKCNPMEGMEEIVK